MAFLSDYSLETTTRGFFEETGSFGSDAIRDLLEFRIGSSCVSQISVLEFYSSFLKEQDGSEPIPLRLEKVILVVERVTGFGEHRAYRTLVKERQRLS